jgi:hypothetical protein
MYDIKDNQKKNKVNKFSLNIPFKLRCGRNHQLNITDKNNNKPK